MFEWWRKNRTLLLGLLLLVMALLWYSVNLKQQARTNFLESLVLRLTGPLQSGFDASIGGVADLWGHYVYLVDTAADNRDLLEERRVLRSELDRLQEIDLENRRLRLLLGFKEEVAVPTLPARVIAEDATSWFRTVTIDKGWDDGVGEGMPVVVAEGVVGRVVRSGPGESRVLLVTDASSAIASLVQANRARGICRGQGDLLSFDFVLRQEEIQVGDRVITSGMGGVFPKGLVIGTIQAVSRQEFGLFQAVEVTPAVDFSHLEEVLVLLRQEQP